MDELYKIILENFKTDEPIFTKDLKDKTNLNSNAFRQNVKRLSDKGLIVKVTNGLYFIPRADSILKKPILSVDKIVSAKFLHREGCITGYKSGTNFANSLGLTTQTASVPTIITNHTSSVKREIKFYNKRIIVKKPKVEVNENNYKILQVLDLFDEYERVSEIPLENVKSYLTKYLSDVSMNHNELRVYLDAYPNSVEAKLYKSGVYDEIIKSKRHF